MKNIDMERLDKMLVCSFGKYELEEQAKHIVLEAIEKKNIDILRQDVYAFHADSFETLIVPKDTAECIFRKTGMWQFVEEMIANN